MRKLLLTIPFARLSLVLLGAALGKNPELSNVMGRAEKEWAIRGVLRTKGRPNAAAREFAKAMGLYPPALPSRPSASLAQLATQVLGYFEQVQGEVGLSLRSLRPEPRDAGRPPVRTSASHNGEEEGSPIVLFDSRP
jgi:hypothetical protein